MKNIQVIDGAVNTAYAIYQIPDDDFAVMFPGEGQNVEFVEDFIGRVGENRAGEILSPVWNRRIEKADAQGIHGTLFYELTAKKEFYPNRRESDLLANGSLPS